MRNCLSSEKLLHFATAPLTPGEHQAACDHVGDCPACKTRLSHLREIIALVERYEPSTSVEVPIGLHRRLLSMIPVPPDQRIVRDRPEVLPWTGKIRRIVAQWIDLAPSQPLLARTGSVIGEQCQARLYRAEELEILLVLKPHGGDQWAILGNVLPGENSPQPPRMGDQERGTSDEALLWRSEGNLQRTVRMEKSTFLLDEVERGTYALRILWGDRQIDIESLRVGLNG